MNFPNGEHPDVVVDEGSVSIGSADDNRIVLTAPGVLARHVCVNVDQRGIVLEVLDPAAQTHVNARPVRECALLRLGDSVCIDTVVLALIADDDARFDAEIAPIKSNPADSTAGDALITPSPVLRGVSGAWFGKSIAIGRRLTLGNAGNGEIVFGQINGTEPRAVIEAQAGQLVLRSHEGRLTNLNGRNMRSALLRSGDQLTFNQDRFVVEAPGQSIYSDRASPPNTPVPQSARPQTGHTLGAQETAALSRNAIVWLIGTAALIGAGLAALLLFR
ncbi:MAG: FHA domain-containing protein [Dokdonella sp.]